MNLSLPLFDMSSWGPQWVCAGALTMLSGAQQHLHCNVLYFANCSRSSNMQPNYTFTLRLQATDLLWKRLKMKNYTLEILSALLWIILMFGDTEVLNNENTGLNNIKNKKEASASQIQSLGHQLATTAIRLGALRVWRPAMTWAFWNLQDFG